MITILWGFIGAFAIELAELYSFRARGTERVVVTGAFYWIMTLIMSAMGGLLPLLYQQSGEHVSPLLALNVGASVPLIVKTMVSAVSPIERPKVD